MDAKLDSEVVLDNDKATENIQTEFMLKTYWKDVPYDPATEQTIQISPNTSHNDRFRFEIGSSNPNEYVRLESCALSMVDRDGRAVTGKGMGIVYTI